MCLNSIYKGIQCTSVIKLFDLTCISTGNNERILQSNNLNYNVIYVHPQSHASYYPGASPIAIKLIYDNESVDKRIDDISAVIKLGGKIHDLTELKLSYAPPYSSAKDPVNMVGYYINKSSRI